MTPADPIDSRLTELEIQLEIRAEQVRALNDVVLSQGHQIDVLRRDLDELKERASAADDRPLPSEEPPPPHY